MDFGKYEKYMNDRKAVTVENNRRIEKKFAECEKWVADNLINCGCVFTNHSEYKNNPQGFIKPRGHFVYCIFCYFVFSTSVATARVVCCLFSM